MFIATKHRQIHDGAAKAWHVNAIMRPVCDAKRGQFNIDPNATSALVDEEGTGV